MLAALKALFAEDAADINCGENELRLACAALMIEVATIDSHFDSSEQHTLHQALQQQFGLSQADCLALSEEAEQQRDHATSLHQFTRLINQHFNNQQKQNLLVNMWRIAYADGNIDKYEEHLIRRAADLLHLGHSQFIQAKLTARPN